MSKILILHELNQQNKVHNLIKYMLIFLLFCCLSVTLINSYENISSFGVMFFLVSVPLAFIGLPGYLIKPDIEDGCLEVLLTSFSSTRIVVAKYIALSICSTASFVLIAPIIYIVYNLDSFLFVVVSASALMLILQSGALIVLIGSIQGYFRSNTNFFAILIMPLIVPSIILSGLLIQSPSELHLLAMMIGINLIVIPPSLYFSSYLVENIYNI